MEAWTIFAAEMNNKVTKGDEREKVRKLAELHYLLGSLVAIFGLAKKSIEQVQCVNFVIQIS